MSHFKERKEKTCLNCKADLQGRYCHVCGQENIEPKETLGSLIVHFFYDITHFDGKFFSTVKYLIIKPGYLSKEYMSGRRARYLHPVRMYVFTSAIFFIIFFSVFNVREINTGAILDPITSSLEEEKELALKQAKTREDSIEIEKLMAGLASIPKNLAADSLAKWNQNKRLRLNRTAFSTKEAYDSAQNALPTGSRDRWIKRTIRSKIIDISTKIEKDPNEFLRTWLNKFIHMFPQLLFVSLPIFAFILQLLYIRRRRYYYGDHAIFSIHLYIFAFTALLISFAIIKTRNLLQWNWLNYLLAFLALYFLYYTYKAMLNFYYQGWFKTFVKYFILNVLSFFVILILFVSFFMLSIFQI